MIRKIELMYQNWIVGQFLKYYAIGGHCGLCGKWVEGSIVGKTSRVTICDKCADLSDSSRLETVQKHGGKKDNAT